MSITLLIIALMICLLIEGFFSGSEMALVNTDKYKLALATDAVLLRNAERNTFDGFTIQRWNNDNNYLR